MSEPWRNSISDADALHDGETIPAFEYGGIPDFGITFPARRRKRISISVCIAVAVPLAFYLWANWPEIRRLQIDRQVAIGMLALIYFLPTLLAALRYHRSFLSIAAVNLFLGWTVVGWIVALGTALSRRRLRTERCHDFRLTEAVMAPMEPLVLRTVVVRDRLGWIYMLQAGNCFKIGKATKLDRRIYQLKIQLPYKVELVHAIQTDDIDHAEQHWHMRFESKRMNGEWFELTANDVREFKQYEFHEIANRPRR
jgi:Superinfection immunity protein/Meiotically up-regulated gene 113